MRMFASRLARFVARLAVGGMLMAGVSADGQTNGQPHSYETTFYPSGRLKIEAYLYKPEGPGPFPVVIYNHGSRGGHEREERPFVYVGEIMVDRGYLVIVPERRGYGQSDGPTLAKRSVRIAAHDSWRVCGKRPTMCWRWWSSSRRCHTRTPIAWP